MSIEVAVRKEISSFESRPAFGMTGRQLITAGIALPIGAGMFFLFYNLMGVSAGSNAAILTALPIFAIGLFKKDGYYIEKYLPIIISHRFKPQKMFYQAESSVLEYMTAEERDKDLSRILLNAHPAKTTAALESCLQFQSDIKRSKRITKAAYKSCKAAIKELAADKKAFIKAQKKATRGGKAKPSNMSTEVSEDVYA